MFSSNLQPLKRSFNLAFRCPFTPAASVTSPDWQARLSSSMRRPTGFTPISASIRAASISSRRCSSTVCPRAKRPWRWPSRRVRVFSSPFFKPSSETQASRESQEESSCFLTGASAGFFSSSATLGDGGGPAVFSDGVSAGFSSFFSSLTPGGAIACSINPLMRSKTIAFPSPIMGNWAR